MTFSISEINTLIPDKFKYLNFLTGELLKYYPEHAKFINSRFDSESNDNLVLADKLSEQIITIVEKDIVSYVNGYIWTCDTVLEEEIHFRRNNCKYRLSKFQDAYDEVYSRPEVMVPYMKGLLLTQVFWKNHMLVHTYFNQFLEKFNRKGTYIEIGAGHGLFLANACRFLSDKFDIQAWDISESSLKETRNCLKKLNIGREFHLIKQDFNNVKDSRGKADLLVFSEILEHLEDPLRVLVTLKNLLNNDGVLFLNAPVNSPAPDHITNWDTPDQLISQVREAGFEVLEEYIIPATGLTIDKALKYKGAISVVLIAQNS